jgi:hypothetical protein
MELRTSPRTVIGASDIPAKPASGPSAMQMARWTAAPAP